jgi:ubiquinol-cytochrome c reductase cytochrome c subunit
MPLVRVGRTDAAGRPLEPMPQRLEGDPDMEPHRHQPAYDRPTIDRLVSYVGHLAADGGPDLPAAGTGDVAEGGELFRLQCAACHTSTGDGGALLRREAPSLHDADERETAEAIRVGPGQMPAFGDAAMTDAQVASVVAYVKYLDHPRDRGGQALLHLGPVAEGGLALVAVFVMLLFARWIGERG